MKSLLLALLACALPLSAVAQEMALTGVVTTRDDGMPLPGATVSIESLRLSTTTDASGRYALSLPAGTATDRALEVRVSAAGLLPRLWSFKPAAGTVTHDFALALTFSEEITVGSRAVGARRRGRCRWTSSPRGRSRPPAPARRCRSIQRARAFVQLPAHDDRRRLGLGAARRRCAAWARTRCWC